MGIRKDHDEITMESRKDHDTQEMDTTSLLEQGNDVTPQPLKKNPSILDYRTFLLNVSFLMTFSKRVGSIVMMIFDMGSDLKLAIDLSSEAKEGGMEENNRSSSNFSIATDIQEGYLRTLILRPKLIANPVWFTLTLTFFYLPHLINIISCSWKDILTKFFLHGFRPLNLLETQAHCILPRWAEVIINMDKNKYNLSGFKPSGVVILVFFWIFHLFFKFVVFIIMPLLVIGRQLRKLTILFHLESLYIDLGLSAKYSEFCGKKLRKNWSDIVVEEGNGNHNNFGAFERWVFKDPETLIGRNTKSQSSSQNKSKQAQLLDSMMNLSGERIKETFFESAPQATLQIYMGIIDDEAIMSLTRIFSITTSMLALAMASCDYTNHKLRRHFYREEPTTLGIICIVAWKFPALAARCVSMAVFFAYMRSYESRLLFLCVIGFHVACFSSIEYRYLDETYKGHWCGDGNSSVLRTRLFWRLIEQGWISLFTWLEYRTLKYNKELNVWEDHDDPKVTKLPRHHLRNLIIYNLIIFLQNTAMLLPSYFEAREEFHSEEEELPSEMYDTPGYIETKILIVIVVVFACPISLLAMLLVQVICHVDSDILKPAKKRLFRKSKNFFENQFMLLKESISQSNLEDFKVLIAKLDEKESNKLFMEMSLIEIWKNKHSDIDGILDALKIGYAISEKVPHTGSKWLLSEVYDTLLKRSQIFRENCIESFKLAWELGQIFCMDPYCTQENCENYLSTEHERSESNALFTTCYFFTIMFSEGKYPFCSEQDKMFTNEVTRKGCILFPNENNELKLVRFMFKQVKWNQLNLDPILKHQLKIALDPENPQKPSYKQFIEGPAFMTKQSKENFLVRFLEKIKLGGTTSKQTELLVFLEQESHLVTGNNFLQLKDKDSKTIQEHVEGAKKLKVRKGSIIPTPEEPHEAHEAMPMSYETHKTLAYTEYVHDAVRNHGCVLQLFIEVSPNWWPVVIRLMFSYSKYFDYSEMRQDNFIYWIGKFTSMELNKFETVTELSAEIEKNEAQSNVKERYELRKLMQADVSKSINRMRKVCEPSSKRYKSKLDQLSKLKKRKEEKEMLKQSLEQTERIQREIDSIKTKIGELELVDEHDIDKEMYDHEVFLSKKLKKIQNRFNPSTSQSPSISQSSSQTSIQKQIPLANSTISPISEGEEPLDDIDNARDFQKCSSPIKSDPTVLDRENLNRSFRTGNISTDNYETCLNISCRNISLSDVDLDMSRLDKMLL